MQPLRQSILDMEAIMSVADIYEKRATFSFEVFPPKTDVGMEKLCGKDGVLDKLYTLQQKFHVETVTELIATRDRIAEQLAHIDNGDEDIEEKEKEVAALLAKAEKQAALLTSIRQKSAKAIEKEMKGRLIPLGIPNVRFEIAFAEKPPVHF